MAIKDFTTDDSLAFLLLLKEANALPEWVKSSAEAPEVQSLPDVAFADAHRRLMPIHTKTATFLSAVGSVVYDYPVDGGWAERLKVACRHYGIEDLVKKAHSVLTPEEYHEKAAGETQKIAHALEIVVEPGQVATGFYPINSADEVESSALKLASDMSSDKLPGTWFAEAADAIVKAADAHGLSLTLLPRTVLRMAEDRLPSSEELQVQIERRVKQANLSPAAESFYKEAAIAALEGAPALEAAHVWELADRRFDIRQTDGISSPVSAFRSGIPRSRFEKLAGEWTTIAGIQLPFNRLAVLPDELLAAVLPLKIAGVALSAKSQPDGLKAASVMEALSEAEQLQVLQLITESASA